MVAVLRNRLLAGNVHKLTIWIV